MPITAGLVAGGAGVIGNLVGGSAASSQAAAATAAQQAALQKWLSINVPDPAQQQIELQKYAVTGQLSPALQTAFQQSPSNLTNMQISPTSRAAEVQALSQMQNLAQNGGMDAQAEQQETQAINQSNANEAGQRGAIVQNFAARGEGGSGAQLAAELQSSQGDANQAAASGQSAAANAQSRALNAMTNSSNMASNLNSQDYTQAANAATAQDAINKFNTQTQQQVSNANTNAQNSAQATNLQNSQNVANQNTGVENTQETHNQGLAQQEFEDQDQVATGVSNAEKGVAGQANQNASNAANMWGGIGSAIAGGATAVGQAANNSDDDSEDESEE